MYSGGATLLSGPIGKLPKGLQKLSLSRCGLTGKGIAQISHALGLNRSMTMSLQYLNLSENTLKEDINVSAESHPVHEDCFRIFYLLCLTIFIRVAELVQFSGPTQ